MRLPSALFQQLAIRRGGTILEEGDGELLLPPVLQMVAEIGSPLHTAISPIGLQHQTSLNTESSIVSGVAAAFSADVITLGAGVWSLHLTWRWQFAGTTDITKGVSLRCVDPSGNFESLFADSFFNPSSIQDSKKILVVLSSDNWILRLTRDATIAGDVANLYTSCYALKIL